MYAIPERLKAAMDARLHSQPINARHLIVASGISFDEMLLPPGTHAILSYENDAFHLSVSNTLGEMTQNIVYAKALAHLLLHSDRFSPGTAWVDGTDAQVPVAHTPAPLTDEDEAAAQRMAIEILVPTVALRQAFLYHQGATAAMAKAFGVPQAVIHAACVRRGLLDPRAVAA